VVEEGQGGVVSSDRWSAVQGEVESAWADRSRLERPQTRSAVEKVIAALDAGELRVAGPSPAVPPTDDGGPRPWIVHAWVKEAILLYFALRPTESFAVGPFQFRDKIPLKQDPEGAGIRVVPPATIRYGAFLERGVVAMPCYVNIGARVGAGTMIDTWATVGSCAQIGRNVHVSGGVGIGGVLEPPQAQPVVIEDGAFLGSRVIVVEGVRVGEGAVLGAGLVLTASTPIVDVRAAVPVILRGFVPSRAVVIPGQLPRKFPAGEYGVPCALVIGERGASTDEKTSLNSVLREYPLET
jgi:2,3,4,5-tetrahydropyridine-2,6-dicarboxylate N-succinyltransferase